jgi:uncharacterized protein YjbJ (UPF0337 family)
MNWDRIEGRWKQLKGKALQRWAKITDDEWEQMQGNREEIVGKLQSSYGKQKDQAERGIDEWIRESH